jgi:hypothetical protein
MNVKFQSPNPASTDIEAKALPSVFLETECTKNQYVQSRNLKKWRVLPKVRKTLGGV